MEFSRWANIFVVLAMAAFFSSGALFILKDAKFTLVGQPASVASFSTQENPVPEVPLFPKKLSNPPEIIKAIYVTGSSAGSEKYLSYLSDLFLTTEINAVVVDIKDSTGKRLTYDTDSLVNFLHSQNIYVIGRIAVFEDPVFSKVRPDLAVYNKTKTTDKQNIILWTDNNGLSWMDPASKEVWDYNIGLAKNGFLHGFDEINFDYVRYPSDGKSSSMGFPISDPKVPSQSVIKEFFQYTRSQLAGEKISADLFGQTTIDKNDMGIGQILENAFENFDYVAPMIYPSHYANGFAGFENPAKYPYEVVKYSLDKGLVRKNEFVNKNGEAVGTPAEETKLSNINVAKFRPWLQDFDMGAIYDAEMIKKEIQATKDSLGADYAGYMLWNASNIYTKDAVTK